MFEDAIFVDVGGHSGQTLDEVTRPKYQFRTIFCLEPMPRQFTHIQRAFRAFPAVQAFDYGLGDHTGMETIYGTNDRCEASIYPQKTDVGEMHVTTCTIVEASNWLDRNTDDGDTVIMKINAEGSEIPIMNNLIDTGMVWRLANVMLDFDIRRVPGMEHTEGQLMGRMAEIGFDRFSLCDNVMVGNTHQRRIRNWLSTIV